MTCPLCSSTATRQFSTEGYWIDRCGHCGHEFAELGEASGHVSRVYGDSYFQGGGAGYTNYLAESALLRDRGRYYAKLLARFTQPGRLLDVGAAAGFIASGYAESGWRVSGVEPNDSMAKHGREQLGLDIRTGTLESLDSSEQFDVISIIQVMAHFVSPLEALSNAARLTAPGGFLLIETWNRDSWTRRLFGQSWHEYSPPSVLHWFTPESLEGAAARCGFQACGRGRPAKWIHSDHAVSLVRHKLDSTPLAFAGRLAEKIVPAGIPIPYPAEDLFWALFRKK